MIEKIKLFLRKFWIYTFGFAFLILMLVLIYQRLAYTHITAEFDELRPIKGFVNVFYKGYKIGKVLYIKPNSDFTKTYMKIAIFHTSLKLPKNISVKLLREKDKWRKIDYIEIIYPEEPTVAYLKDGDFVLGKSTVDIETYLSSQEADSLDNIRKSMEDTISSLNDLFISLRELVEENRPNLRAASGNLSDAAKNLDDMTRKLNKSIKQQNLNKTMENLDKSIDNVAKTTHELEIISGNVNLLTNDLNSTVPSFTTSVNEIACGVANTLKKRFGGLRLFFGKVIDKDCTKCN